MYNAVGIDVSKGKSTVAVLQPGGTVIRKPFDVSHTSQNLNELADYLSSLDGTTKIVMECTGRYHEPMVKALSEAGLFVSIVNPHLIKNFGNNSLRKVKSDPVDARKIARYTLDNWTDLRQYSGMNNTRTQLKTLNSQFSFFMKQKVAAKANLIALLDNTYPGVNKLFDSPTCEDGSEKWVDYSYSFWHADCVRKIGLKAFTERYMSFCKKHHYIFQQDKPEKLFNASKELVAVWSGSDPRTDPDRRDRLYDARDFYYGTCKSKDRTDFPFPDAELCFRTADRRDRQDDTFHPARNVFHRIIRRHTSGNLFLPEIRTRKRNLVFDIPQYFRILQRGI